MTSKNRVIARLLRGICELPLVLELVEKDDNKTDCDKPGGREPGDRELLAHDAGVPVHGKGLEPLDGHPKDREEARDHGDDKETVDEDVLVAGYVKSWVEGQDPIEEEAEGEED